MVAQNNDESNLTLTPDNMSISRLDTNFPIVRIKETKMDLGKATSVKW